MSQSGLILVQSICNYISWSRLVIKLKIWEWICKVIFVLIFVLIFFLPTVSSSFSGIVSIAVVTIFYTGAFRRDWMPYPYKNDLGYSYWFEVVTAILLIIAFFLTLVAAILKVLKHGEQYKYASCSDISERPESFPRSFWVCVSISFN